MKLEKIKNPINLVNTKINLLDLYINYKLVLVYYLHTEKVNCIPNQGLCGAR